MTHAKVTSSFISEGYSKKVQHIISRALCVSPMGSHWVSSKFLYLNRFTELFFGISSSGLAYNRKSTKISQILRFRLLYFYRLNRYLGNSWSDFSCQFLEYNISNYNYFYLCPWCVCVHARCTWSCNSANHAHKPCTWIWSLPKHLVCYLKPVACFLFGFYGFLKTSLTAKCCIWFVLFVTPELTEIRL